VNIRIVADWTDKVLPTLNQEIYQLHSSLCHGLADPTRILILYALQDAPLNVTELAQHLKLPQPTASRHLKVLRERGMVIARREGQSVFYSVTDDRIMQALDLMRSVLADLLKDQANLVAQE
jgi:ArsR family transcriptional regulator